MARYKDLFFDLDHTLWDFETNSRSALEELFEDYLNPLTTSFEGFHQTYVDVNHRYWEQYRAGRVTKRDLRFGRFRDSLQRFGMQDESLTRTLAEEYVKRSPYHTALFPNTLETLSELNRKGYSMHIITNGFEEIQHIKLKESGLRDFFEEIVTSELVSKRKPHPKIFEFALDCANATKEESIMIGDNLHADILGAKQFGIDQVFFNPDGLSHEAEPTYEITDLRQLEELL
ncbi:MAG: noncanonical pyrimidine nucleotidase, YjjG family [Flavobacteriales bacterium]|nr:noncanonical pyrimidine nucleotidase, YjjG family [Flavobacteriales bacterium]NNK80018.1 noncanonical pyrimidine nucleotidase, YjjG family [Flavobacteriales bacterium]